MIRSICIVSREYPPETADGGIGRVSEMTARGLVDHGVAVHVISLDRTGQGRRVLQDGVAVYRLPMPTGAPAGHPEVEQGLWAATVANFYQALDATVGFDAIWAPDYFAESMAIQPAPGTVLAVQLHATRAVVHPDRCDRRRDPAFAAAADMEQLALGRADILFAPTQLIATETAGRAGSRPPVAVLAPPLDGSRFAARTHVGPHELELVFVGRLEPNKRPELVLHTVAELARRDVDARVTLVGRDTPTGPSGQSYRRAVLRPLMDDLGLGFDRVRFVEQLDLDGVARHLAAADAAVLPSRFENFHTAAAEALAAGVPVICGDRCGLRHWLTPDDGLLPVATDDAVTFGRLTANQLADRDRLEDVGRRGAASVRRLFDPAAAVGRQLDLLAQVRADRLVGGLGSAVGLGTGHRSRRALRPSPKLGVVVLAHNALGYTKRCIASLLHHTTVPLRLVVVDNASTDGTADWLRDLDDDRVRPVLLPENRGVPGGRNVGLDHLDGDENWIVFLDNDTEVLADWWAPYVAALDADPDAGIAGEDGVRVTWGPDGRELHPVVGDGPQPCDVAVGFCLFLRPETVARIGRFDESLGLFWHDDDDYAMRAARIGERVLRLRAGKVLHFEHRSSATVAGIWDGPSTPAAMSADNQRYVATKVARQRPTPTSRFLVLAHADEVLGDPALLATYGQAFTAADEASLVVYGPSVDPVEFERALRTVADEAGVDVERGPQVAAILPPTAAPATDREVADQVYAVLSARRPQGPFAHLAVVRPDDPDGLRLLAARAWRARPARPDQAAREYQVTPAGARS
jgi:glycogen synthase